MSRLPQALALAFAQLGDRRILAVLVKSLLWTLAIFGVLGVALYYGLAALFAYFGWFAATEWTVLLSLVIAFAGGWLLFRIVALAVMQFFAEDVVRTVEARHYADIAGEMHSLPLGREIRLTLRSALRALVANLLAAPVALALLFTAIGPAIVFGLVNAVLLGRELQDMVWQRHPMFEHGTRPLGAATRFALGAVVTLMLATPFLNLLAPIIGAAAAAHLVHRHMATGPAFS